MIEIDWDKIRENTLKLVCGYRDTYAGKEWKCRELLRLSKCLKRTLIHIKLSLKIQSHSIMD